jgi:dUTP pyrophosphatase
VRLGIRRLDPDLPLPSYARRGDAGLDLLAARSVTLKPGERASVPTGVALAIPEGWAGLIHARSGRAMSEGLALVNAPGLIDSGYRGEVKVLVVNLDSSSPIYIRRGEKVAQLVIQRVERADLHEVNTLDPTERNEGGFGSSGS